MHKNVSILLTGASGFVGSALLTKLSTEFVYSKIHCLGRSDLNGNFSNSSVLFRKTIDAVQDFSSALEGIQVVIHAAARAHVMNEDKVNAERAYNDINVLGTLNLAEQAVKAGVKRFIFISSIKVNGEATLIGKPFINTDEPEPLDPYGRSKADAEKGLMNIARQSNMEVVIIRPPLVYGPGVKANFASMMKLASKNLPLPLGSIKNKRSLVGIDNLVDLIITCINHPKASNQTFLVSDDHDVSTTELLRELTISAGKKPRLIPLPMNTLRILATLLGKKGIADRLCGSLQVDISHTKKTLDWIPPVSFQEGIARCFVKDKQKC